MYARNDLWYEALEEVFNISDQSTSQKLYLSLIHDLILVYKNELDKEIVETKKQYIQQRINSLKSISTNKVGK